MAVDRNLHWLRDLSLRALGLLGVGLATAIFCWLSRLIHAHPTRDGSLGQYLVAGFGFLCATGGTGLLVLGYHIHDPIELSERWRPRA